MDKILIALGMAIGGGIALYTMRFFLGLYVTGTSFSENMLTYFVPLGILTASIIFIFKGKKKKQ